MPRAKGVIAAWRLDMGGDVVLMNPPGHGYQPISQDARGTKIPVFINSPAQDGVKSRIIFKLYLSAGYRQRVDRTERRLGTVAADDFPEGQLADVLAVKPGRDLRRCEGAERRAEHEAQP